MLPLTGQGAEVTVTFEVTAHAPEGIPPYVVDLVIKEGLQQLGLDHQVDTH